MEEERPKVVPIGSAKPRPPKQPQQVKVPVPVLVTNWAWVFVALLAGFVMGLILSPYLNPAPLRGWP